MYQLQIINVFFLNKICESLDQRFCRWVQLSNISISFLSRLLKQEDPCYHLELDFEHNRVIIMQDTVQIAPIS